MYVGKARGKLEKEVNQEEAPVDHGLLCRVDLDFLLPLIHHFN